MANNYAQYIGNLKKDEITYDQIVNDLKKGIPDIDSKQAADWGILISALVNDLITSLGAVGEEAIEKKLKLKKLDAMFILFEGGLTVAVDTTTNIISDDLSTKTSYTKDIATAVAATLVGMGAAALSSIFATGIVLTMGLTATSFFMGNQIAAELDNILNFLTGAGINAVSDQLKSNTLQIVTSSSEQYPMQNILRRHWTNFDESESMTSDSNKDKVTEIFINYGDGVVSKIKYIKDTNTFEIEDDNFTNESFLEILRYQEKGATPTFVINGETKVVELNLLAETRQSSVLVNKINGYTEDEIISMFKNNKKALFAGLARKEYVLDTEMDGVNKLNPNLYSEEFKDKITTYLHYRISPQYYTNSYGFVDISSIPNVSISGFKTIGFGEGDGKTLDVTLSNKDNFLFGYADGMENGGSVSKYKDIIKSGSGDDYIEGGIGEDRLYGGSGNDTIYTHANIEENMIIKHQQPRTMSMQEMEMIRYMEVKVQMKFLEIEQVLMQIFQQI